MERQEYSVKDIILGMKEEYEQNERMLELLKIFTTTYDRNVKDFYYKLNSINGSKEDKQIEINFIQSQKTLRGIINYLQKKIRLYYFGGEIGKLKKDENGRYIIENEFFDAFVEPKNMEKFGKIVDEILASDFSDKSNFDMHYNTKERYNISIFPNRIIYSDSKRKIDYDSKKETIRVLSNFYLNPNMVEALLNTKITGEFLTQYQKDTIAASRLPKKRLRISPEAPLNNIETFYITEEENTVTLRKVKKENAL